MSLLPFLAVAIGGAMMATLLRHSRWLGSLAGLGAVAVALGAACLVRPGDPLVVGGGALAGTDHLRIVLGLCLAGGFLVLVVARLATWQPSAPGALLGGAAGIGIALGLAGTAPGILGAAAATIAASVLALGSPAAPSRVRALARELRGATTSVVIGLIAAGILPGPTTSAAPGAAIAEPAAAALVLVGVALVVAHRFGAIPLHARVSRLADAAPSGALPILAAWLPAAWGLIIVGWAPAAFGPSAAGLGPERGLVVALAVATLVLGTLAALIQDEVEHVVAYTIVADAGIVLLALAALDPGARDAARAWVLVLATTRTAMIGWTIAFRAAFGTGRLRDTAGWLRRAPALGVALGVVLAAAVGWPGLLAWDARLAIIRSATSGPVLLLVYAGSLGTGLAIVRLLVVGAGRPSAIVTGAPAEVPRLPAPPVPAARTPLAIGVTPSAGGSARAGARARAGAVGGRLRALGATIGRDARPSLELNRVPLRAFAVILLAGLALLTAAGAFGIDAAARAPGPVVPSPAPTAGG